MPGHATFLEKTPAFAPHGARSVDAAPHARVSAPLSSHTGAASPAASGGAANVRALQRLVGNQAVMRMLDARRTVTSPAAAVQAHHDDGDEVQRDAAGLGELSDQAIRSAAAEGVRTPSSSLPFLDQIQASFGRHPVTQVQAHVGPQAAEASRAMNARAYASGDHVVFGGAPDLRTAAHEAAHVVQQRTGVQLAGGVGRAGDPYERHADAVAGAVVAGRSAEALLEPFGTPGGAIDTQPVQRMYSGSDEEKSPIGENDDHQDLSAIKELIRNAFAVDDEDYEFVTDDGSYVGGTGNCHGYSLDGDLNEKLWLYDPQDFLEAYDQRGEEQKITVFTKGGEVAHSARGHGGACEHKVYVESGWGPLIKASAASVAGAYDQQFEFPEEREDFEQWIGTQGELQDQQEIQNDVMITFYYFIKYNPNDVLAKVQPKQLEGYRKLSQEDGSEEGVTKVLEAMEAITGERFDSPEAFLKKYKDSW